MQNLFKDPSLISAFTIMALLLLVGGYAVYYFFIIQKKKFQLQEQKFIHEKEKLELREAFNQTLLQSKIEIQEQTLDHIAKELHANIGHLASLININLSELLPQSSEGQQDTINESKLLARQLMSELKVLSASLNTDHIMHIGFIKALDAELNRIGRVTKCQISFTKTGQDYRLRPEHEIILFRLCQEILNNTVKYARAKSVTTLLEYTDTALILEIKDDGIGFDVEAALDNSAEKLSTGLVNIRKRAKLIDAEVTIQSQPNQGTIFTIHIPKK